VKVGEPDNFFIVRQTLGSFVLLVMEVQ